MQPYYNKTDHWRRGVRQIYDLSVPIRQGKCKGDNEECTCLILKIKGKSIFHSGKIYLNPHCSQFTFEHWTMRVSPPNHCISVSSTHGCKKCVLTGIQSDHSQRPGGKIFKGFLGVLIPDSVESHEEVQLTQSKLLVMWATWIKKRGTNRWIVMLQKWFKFCVREKTLFTSSFLETKRGRNKLVKSKMRIAFCHSYVLANCILDFSQKWGKPLRRDGRKREKWHYVQNDGKY